MKGNIVIVMFKKANITLYWNVLIIHILEFNIYLNIFRLDQICVNFLSY